MKPIIRPWTKGEWKFFALSVTALLAATMVFTYVVVDRMASHINLLHTGIEQATATNNTSTAK